MLKAELEHEAARLIDRRHWLTLERIFIENRVYKQIESAKTAEAVAKAVCDGMEPFKKQFVRPMVDADVDAPARAADPPHLGLRHRARTRRRSRRIVESLAEVEKKLGNMVKTTIAWLEDMLDRYGKDWPRRTELAHLRDRRQARRGAREPAPRLRPRVGLLRLAVRGEALLAHGQRVRAHPDRLERRLLPHRRAARQDARPRQGALDLASSTRRRASPSSSSTATPKKQCFGKRIHLKGYIKGKEYSLDPGRRGRRRPRHRRGEARARCTSPSCRPSTSASPRPSSTSTCSS